MFVLYLRKYTLKKHKPSEWYGFIIPEPVEATILLVCLPSQSMK